MTTSAPRLRDGGLVVVGLDMIVEPLPIRDVRLPDNHVGMDVNRAVEYTTLLRAGHELPPPLVYRAPDGCLWLIDGRHRFVAHLMAGRDRITAVTTGYLGLEHQ